MSDALTTEAAADDEDGVNSPNTQKRLDFAAALKKDAPSPGVARVRAGGDFIRTF